MIDRLKHLLPGAVKAIENAPIYDVEAFTRHLDDRQWRWYSHDPATLRAADGHYRDHFMRDNFSFFDRKKLSFLTEAGEALIVGHDSFLDDAAKGELRDVSWIDPNFIDLKILDPNSNDDHPPSDIRAGQALVLEVYEALSRSPAWDDTLLVIVYDEHGGFYDHVPPPAVHDDSGYTTLGVRVPALIVGPRVKQFVCHETFDHTTLIKTILTRFASDPEQAIAEMPQRVQQRQPSRRGARSRASHGHSGRGTRSRGDRRLAGERPGTPPRGARRRPLGGRGRRRSAIPAARIPGRVRAVRPRDARARTAQRPAVDPRPESFQAAGVSTITGMTRPPVFAAYSPNAGERAT